MTMYLALVSAPDDMVSTLKFLSVTCMGYRNCQIKLTGGVTMTLGYAYTQFVSNFLCKYSDSQNLFNV